MELAKQKQTRQLAVEPATEAHGAQLASEIRPEDAAEMMASHGLEPLAGIQMALRTSRSANAILDGDTVLAIFGVTYVEGEPAACAWLLATNAVKRLPIAFMRVLAREVALLSKTWGHLVNMVWAQNKRALRLVQSLGFEVMVPVPHGVSGLLFHPILLRRV